MMSHVDTRSARNVRAADWYKSATRWTQLTLAEDDPVRFDPGFWIDFFRRSKSNATCLSAGGYIAYYPSKVPLHYVSKFLGDKDPFGDLVEGARGLGMHVMARVDPHAIHQDAADAHPEWIAVDKDGNKRRHWAYPSVWVTCAYSAYNFEFMPQVLREITRAYDIDAIFANRWQGHGVCYCDNCRTSFGVASGYELPLSPNPDDAVWMAWTAWRRSVLSRLVVEWDDAMKAIKPNVSFIPNMGGVSLMEFDLDLIERYCPFIVVDDQGRRGTEPVWMAGRNGKRIRATFPDRPAILITSIGPEERHRWKDAVTTGPEIQSWTLDGMTQGLRPWFTKFNGVVPDKRWVEPIIDCFDIHARLETALAATTPKSEIAILDPSTTLRHHGAETRAAAEADDLGFYHALVEAKLPFELLSDHALTPQKLDRFKVLILANSTCLSNAQCAELEAFVARGGSLVAAFETSARDENNRPRGMLALGDLFGVSSAKPTRGSIRNTYVALNGDHPLSEGYQGAERIIGGTHLIDVEVAPDVEIPFLYVPDFPDLPMEEVYAREQPSKAAVLARRHKGGGRTVYIPWNIGAIFWDVLAADHQRLIANAVRWALGKPGNVEATGKAMLDIAVREGTDTLIVTMYNLSNPMMMKGPVREIHPVGRQELSIAIPEGRTFAAAKLLVAGRNADAKVEGRRVVIAVPGIDLIEVAQIIWE